MTTVLDAVNSITQDARERLALLMGALLEGGSIGAGPFPTGDNGTSYGPFQFHFVGSTKLGLTPQQAQDPALATRAIYPSYKAAVARVPDALWNSDPATAAATAAYYAESPAYMYPANRVQSAFASLSGAVTSLGNTTTTQTSNDGGIVPVFDPTFGVAGSIVDGLQKAGDAIAAPFKGVADFIAKIIDPHLWWRVFFVIGGIAIAGIGFSIMSGNKGIAAAGTFAGTAAKAP